MATWTERELGATGNAEELTTQTTRRDGPLRDFLIVWGVHLGDDLYIRAARGRASPWFRGMRSRHEGQIVAGGVERDITLVETDKQANEIDAAYRDKYRRYPGVVPSIVSPEARAATLQHVPRHNELRDDT